MTVDAHGDRLSLFATPMALFEVADSDALNRELCVRLVHESQTTPGLRRSNAGGWHSPPDLAQRPEEPFQQVVRLIVDHVAQLGRELVTVHGPGGDFDGLRAFSREQRAVGGRLDELCSSRGGRERPPCEQVRELYALAERPPPPGLRYGAQAWAMVMRDGDHTVLHEHGEAHWSAAYYADAGDADPARHPTSGVLGFVDPRRGGRSLPGLESGTTFEVRPRSGMLVVFPGWLQHYVSPYRGTRPRVTVSCNVTVEMPRPDGGDR